VQPFQGWRQREGRVPVGRCPTLCSATLSGPRRCQTVGCTCYDAGFRQRSTRSPAAFPCLGSALRVRKTNLRYCNEVEEPQGYKSPRPERGLGKPCATLTACRVCAACSDWKDLLHYPQRAPGSNPTDRRSPPAAPHLVLRRRSCSRLQVTLTWRGLSLLRPMRSEAHSAAA
jgi:hypothetical protein